MNNNLGEKERKRPGGKPPKGFSTDRGTFTPHQVIRERPAVNNRVVMYCHDCDARIPETSNTKHFVWYEVIENYEFGLHHREQKRVKIMCRKCYRERMENGPGSKVTSVSKGKSPRKQKSKPAGVSPPKGPVRVPEGGCPEDIEPLRAPGPGVSKSKRDGDRENPGSTGCAPNVGPGKNLNSMPQQLEARMV